VTKAPQVATGYGNDALPTPAEALMEPMRAFPSWFLASQCERW
jgi:hypothetical protein